MRENKGGASTQDPLLSLARSTPLLTSEEEAELATKAARGDRASLDRMLTAHFRLVLAIAREYRSYGLSQDELVSEGLLGLVEAARRFDPERGVRLAPYAAWWIRTYVRSYTLSNRRIVRMPTSRNGRVVLAKLRKAQRALAQEHAQRPDAEAVAKLLGVTIRDVEEVESALSGRDLSCDPGPNERAFDLPCSGPTPENIVADAQESWLAREALRGAMGGLSKREQDVLQRRYFEGEPETLASLGRELGVSRERVRQIEHGACATLRAALQAKLGGELQASA